MNDLGIILQCRMSSSRLPGKTLMLAEGKPLLQYAVERLQHCARGTLAVVTSNQPSDQPIVAFCDSLGLSCYTGPLENVAQRFAGALELFGFDAFVRICGDSPLIDQRIVDRAVELFINSSAPMVSNILRRTFPMGQSVEVLNSEMFLDKVRDLVAPEDYEHVTPYFYKNLCNGEIVNFESGGEYGEMRHCVDTPEDMERFTRMVSAMDRPHWEYSYLDLLEMEGQA